MIVEKRKRTGDVKRRGLCVKLSAVLLCRFVRGVVGTPGTCTLRNTCIMYHVPYLTLLLSPVPCLTGLTGLTGLTLPGLCLESDWLIWLDWAVHIWLR